MKIEIKKNEFKGQKLKYKIGEIVEMADAKAMQFIKHKLAVDVNKKVKAPKKTNKVIDPIKENK